MSRRNEAGIVCGLVDTPTAKYPDGIRRVVLMGDPTSSLGSVSEPECRRIIEAIDLAERLAIPVEWFALSSGAKISRDSGTENMDWVSRALRRMGYDDGQVVESGRHDDLLARGGLYAELYRTQFASQKRDEVHAPLRPVELEPLD